MSTFLLFALLTSASISPLHLRCESRVDPRGVDTIQPRLSWTLDSSERRQVQIRSHAPVAHPEEAIDIIGSLGFEGVELIASSRMDIDE